MLWGLGIRHPSEVAKLEERLTTAGFPTIDISGIEAAQACLRTLARCTLVHEGIRKLWCRSGAGSLPASRILPWGALQASPL